MGGRAGIAVTVGVILALVYTGVAEASRVTRPQADDAPVEVDNEEAVETQDGRQRAGGAGEGRGGELEGRWRSLRNRLDTIVGQPATRSLYLGGLGYQGCSCTDLAALAAQIAVFEEEVKSVAVLENKLTLIVTAIKQLGAWVNAGVQGPRGPEGEAGTPGPVGETGDGGDPGPDTQHARTGVPGPPGHPGAPGVLGPKGERGDCTKGNKGARGRKGDPGVGPRGRRGSPGPPGEPGEPARDYTLEA